MSQQKACAERCLSLPKWGIRKPSECPNKVRAQLATVHRATDPLVAPVMVAGAAVGGRGLGCAPASVAFVCADGLCVVVFAGDIMSAGAKTDALQASRVETMYRVIEHLRTRGT